MPPFDMMVISTKSGNTSATPRNGACPEECNLDLAEGTSGCNCSMGAKRRSWRAVVQAGAFRLKQDERARRLHIGNGSIHHFFCKTRGIKPCGRCRLDEVGNVVAINVVCLETTPRLKI